MANAIELAKTYVPLLDEKYITESKTAILDSNTELIKTAQNGKDFLIPKISVDGFAETVRAGDFVVGDVSFSWETKTPDYDRNRMFRVDSMDNLETAGLAFGALAKTFQETQSIPEIDAVRFAKYASNAGTTSQGSIASADAFLTALATATSEMDENDVPEEGRILFAPSSLLTPVLTLDTTKSREILGTFSSIVKVPQSRFYSAVKLNDGKTNGQEHGGYVKASGATDLNFLVVHPSAVIQGFKHAITKVVSAEENQRGDYWMIGFRAYGVNEIFDNKTKGIYVHKKAS